MEEAVWRAVYRIISDPERLKRQWQEEIDRQLSRLKGNPDREAQVLVQKLHKLERRRDGYLELAADGDISREELRLKLAEVDGQRGELQKALQETQARQQTIKKLEWERDHNLDFVEALGAGIFVTASPQDRHRIYEALQLRVEVDEDRTICLSGVFEPDLHLHSMIQDPPVDPSKPIPKVPDNIRVLNMTSAALCDSQSYDGPNSQSCNTPKVRFSATVGEKPEVEVV